MELLRKMRGAGEAPPPRSAWSAILATTLAAAVVVGGLTYVSEAAGAPVFLGSFAASALIGFAYPDSPFAQPRNIILGHLIGSACGLAGELLPVGHAWAAASAVGLAIALMKATRTVHPPACSNPLIILALPRPGWGLLLFPTLAGAGLIVVVALFYHNLRRAAPWPRYWF